ncbi:MAG: CoA transferase [Rhodospirillaceae bacterium]|nr:CoA transferase [Rhodospirillaceae bacterium]MBT5297524.1 CoA transferase [Rhodospirillaceae bacterium]MBT6086517.1 CoA transferase [Rhodospirillaceae bacterium]MBT6608261.1 CoA transferase [Rhodospirillaceae bacterium]MBT7249086.1 CoA transferase [Rhodospirillaceae bacterium]
MAENKSPPLKGLRVIDASTVIAGPTIGMQMGDFGADVIKVEHPRGDVLRNTGDMKDGVGLWFKMTNRNKRCITLNFSTEKGQELFKELIKTADVVIENFRTGTMEKWGLGWEDLKAINPRLVMVRVTGFGQTGPYKNRPGFGTIAEVFSGFAAVTGDPDRPPTLPNFGLADGIAAAYGTFATMFALYHRDAQGSGKGQYIDLSIYEPLFQVMGPQPLQYDQLCIIQKRWGNRSKNNAPRNTYQTQDGHWVAISTNSPAIVTRVLTLCGGAEAANDPRFQTPQSRVEHIDEVDGIVSSWIGRHDLNVVLDEFEKAEAAIGPAYSIDQIFEDPQYQARGDIVEIADEDLGTLKMTNAFPFMSETPAEVRHAGARKGQHNDEILGDELGLTADEIAKLKDDGVL